MTEYKEVPLKKINSVKTYRYMGTYKRCSVSIIWGSDHMGWLFFIEKGKKSFNSMRKGLLFKTKDEAIQEAEKYIDTHKVIGS